MAEKAALLEMVTKTLSRVSQSFECKSATKLLASYGVKILEKIKECKYGMLVVDSQRNAHSNIVVDKIKFLPLTEVKHKDCRHFS